MPYSFFGNAFINQYRGHILLFQGNDKVIFLSIKIIYKKAQIQQFWVGFELFI